MRSGLYCADMRSGLYGADKLDKLGNLLLVEPKDHNSSNTKDHSIAGSTAGSTLANAARKSGYIMTRNSTLNKSCEPFSKDPFNKDPFNKDSSFGKDSSFFKDPALSGNSQLVFHLNSQCSPSLMGAGSAIMKSRKSLGTTAVRNAVVANNVANNVANSVGNSVANSVGNGVPNVVNVPNTSVPNSVSNVPNSNNIPTSDSRNKVFTFLQKRAAGGAAAGLPAEAVASGEKRDDTGHPVSANHASSANNTGRGDSATRRADSATRHGDSATRHGDSANNRSADYDNEGLDKSTGSQVHGARIDASKDVVEKTNPPLLGNGNPIILGTNTLGTNAIIGHIGDTLMGNSSAVCNSSTMGNHTNLSTMKRNSHGSNKLLSSGRWNIGNPFLIDTFDNFRDNTFDAAHVDALSVLNNVLKENVMKENVLKENKKKKKKKKVKKYHMEMSSEKYQQKHTRPSKGTTTTTGIATTTDSKGVAIVLERGSTTSGSGGKGSSTSGGVGGGGCSDSKVVVSGTKCDGSNRNPKADVQQLSKHADVIANTTDSVVWYSQFKNFPAPAGNSTSSGVGPTTGSATSGGPSSTSGGPTGSATSGGTNSVQLLGGGAEKGQLLGSMGLVSIPSILVSQRRWTGLPLEAVKSSYSKARCDKGWSDRQTHVEECRSFCRSCCANTDRLAWKRLETANEYAAAMQMDSV